MKKLRTSSFGFTIIELIVVIGIFGILAVFGLPSLTDAHGNFKLRGQAQDIYATFQKARITAIKENANVVIQFFPQDYTPEGGIGSYLAFVDDGSGNGGADNNVQDGEEEILANVTMPRGISLISGSFNGTPSTTFNGRGLPQRKGSVQIRNASRWYKISVSTANIKMLINDDGMWP